MIGWQFNCKNYFLQNEMVQLLQQFNFMLNYYFIVVLVQNSKQHSQILK